VTWNFLRLTFLAEELTIPRYVAPVVIFPLVVLAVVTALVCGSPRRSEEGRRAGTTLAGAGDGTDSGRAVADPLAFRAAHAVASGARQQ
jgi:hypothetical protein